MKKLLAFLLAILLLASAACSAGLGETVCNHKYKTVVTKAPTCKEAGEARLTCTICGDEIITTIDPAHTIVKTAAKEPTCTEPGLTEGKVCSTCGGIVERAQEIPAKGHTPEAMPAKAPTCTEEGYKEGGVKCSVCGVILTEPEKVPATGHTLVTIPGRVPSLIEDGLTEGAYCSVCGETVIEQEYIRIELPKYDWIEEEEEPVHSEVLDQIFQDEYPDTTINAEVVRDEENHETDVKIEVENQGTEEEQPVEETQIQITLTTMVKLTSVGISNVLVKSPTSENCLELNLPWMTYRDELNLEHIVSSIQDVSPEGDALAALKGFDVLEGGVKVDVTVSAATAANEKILIGSLQVKLYAPHDEDTQIVFVNKYNQVMVTSARWVEGKGYWWVPYLGNGYYVPVKKAQETGTT